MEFGTKTPPFHMENFRISNQKSERFWIFFHNISGKIWIPSVYFVRKEQQSYTTTPCEWLQMDCVFKKQYNNLNNSNTNTWPLGEIIFNDLLEMLTFLFSVKKRIQFSNVKTDSVWFLFDKFFEEKNFVIWH